MIKLTSPWQMIALLAICFAALICAHIFAPGTGEMIGGMVTTLVTLLAQRAPDKEQPTSPPTLTLIKGGLAAFLLSFLILACGAVHDVAKPATYGAELAACDQSSTTWEQYTPCCVDVAKRYARNPSFCFRDPPKDAGHD